MTNEVPSSCAGLRAAQLRRQTAMAGLAEKLAVVALVATFVPGCASFSEKECGISDAQRSILKPRLLEFIGRISTENTTFDESYLFTDDGNLMRPKRSWHIEGHKCWAYLFPVDKRPGYSILDGDGAALVDMETMQVSGPIWFGY